MKNALLGAFLGLALLFGGFCTGRRTAPGPESAVDSAVAAVRAEIAAAAQPDTVRERLTDTLRVLRTRTDTLLTRISDTVTVVEVRDAVAAERQSCDSLCARADSASEARLRLLLTTRRVLDSLEIERDRWRGRAQRLFGLGCTAGPTVVADGLRLFGVACGVSVRFRL